MGEKKHSSSRKGKKRSSGSGNGKSKGSHRGGASEMEDSFQARPTNRMGKDHKIQADGDTWREMMAVCEAPEGTNENENGQLVIRSYYQNSRTGERVWDEPPSGATNIIPASDEVRRMATIQLDELHVVKKGGKKTPQKKKTLMDRLFGNNKKKEKKKRGRIEYKPGSQMYANKAKQDTEDALMQEAIAASIAESKGETYVRPPQEQQSSLEEEMAMAQALSMSAAERDAEENALAHALSLSVAEHESVQTPRPEPQIHIPPTLTEPQIHIPPTEDLSNIPPTEEEILARVMEQSKLETKRGEGDLLNYPSDNLNMTAAVNPFDTPASPDDRKMPASGSHNQHQMHQQLQQQQFPSMASTALPFASAPVASMPPPTASASAPNPSAQYAATSNAAAAASASQYAAAMAAAAAPPTMKAPPSYSMTPANSAPPPSYPNNTAPNIVQSYGGPPPPPPSTTTTTTTKSPTYPPPTMRIPVNAPPIPNTNLKPPPAPGADATPFNTAPVFNSHASRPTSPTPPSMFDPYSKDHANEPSSGGASTNKPPSSPADGGLQKMEGSSDASRKMSIFKKRKSSASTKVQDKAGLV